MMGNQKKKVFMLSAVILLFFCIVQVKYAKAEEGDNIVIWGPGNVLDVKENEASDLTIVLPDKGQFVLNSSPQTLFCYFELYNEDMTKQYAEKREVNGGSEISSDRFVNGDLEAGTYHLRYWTWGSDHEGQYSCIATFTPAKTASMELCIHIKRGKKIQLGTIFSNCEDKKAEWAVSNKKIATVNAKGVVKGVKKGTAVIRAYNSSGLVSTIKVKVV